jgi:peptide-N4-(N-acetyl-beta-glucosaminyl)asparagine amidase
MIDKKHDCWKATGPARKAFVQLAKKTNDYLESGSNSVRQTVTWSIYKIGRTEETFIPKVIFSCTEPDARKEVRRPVKESGLLDR